MHILRRAQAVCLLIAVFAPNLPRIRGQTIDLTRGPQLFIDEALIAQTTGVEKVMQHPDRAQSKPLIGMMQHTTQPYVTVLRDPGNGRFRMWYNFDIGAEASIAYAESDDGLHWTTPSLNLLGPDNRLFKIGRSPEHGSYGLSVIDDGQREPRGQRRFKMMWWSGTTTPAGAAVAFSPDGLHWTPYEANPVLPFYDHDDPKAAIGVGDIVDAFYDPIRDRYGALVKLHASATDGWEAGPRAGKAYRRLVGASFSRDFMHWEQPWRVITPEPRDIGKLEFYSAGGTIARGGLLISFVRMLHDDYAPEPGGEPTGIGYTALATSRDGIHWQRHDDIFFDRNPTPGTWDRAMTWIGSAVPVADELYLYYGGYARGHKVEPTKERQIGLARLKLDRFVARRASSGKPGVLRTVPLSLPAPGISGIVVNVDAGRGSLRARVLDGAGQPVPGFGYDECVAIKSNGNALPLRWKQGLRALGTQSIQIEFELVNADLFGFDVLTSTLSQVHQDFASDPGWEGMNNRVEATDPPTITQDFGWSATNHIGTGPGEIGGKITRSRTMAYYAMAIEKPLTFRDAFSASGKLVLMPGEKIGGAYIGFFNHQRQEWRPWSSMAWRLGDYPRGAEIHMDYMTATWLAGGLRLPVIVPADGSVHAWRMDYDPDATIDPHAWPVPWLEALLTTQRQAEADLYQRAIDQQPGLTTTQFRSFLEQAAERGLAGSTRLNGFDAWWRTSGHENYQGAFSFQVDRGRVFRIFLSREERNAPVELDRFGLFNFQLYGRHWEFYDNESTGTTCEFYIADLVVNATPIDLTQDPGWEGVGNRVTFVDRDFHGRHDFGYSQTNWAGQQIGEIGGTIWRNEVIDPIHAYYADPVGTLTLEDPISFSGDLVFVDGATDGDVQIGFFNADQRKAVFTGGNREYPPDLAQQKEGRRNIHLGFDTRATSIGGVLGFNIGGPTRVGFYFAAMCKPSAAAGKNQNGPIIHPDRRRRHFVFDYDPHANNGIGSILAKLDGEQFTMDLTPEIRAAGGSFTHFGVSSVRVGGKWVTIYLDDLTYTTRRRPGERRDRYPQNTTFLRYPPSGRTY